MGGIFHFNICVLNLEEFLIPLNFPNFTLYKLQSFPKLLFSPINIFLSLDLIIHHDFIHIKNMFSYASNVNKNLDFIKLLYTKIQISKKAINLNKYSYKFKC